MHRPLFFYAFLWYNRTGRRTAGPCLSSLSPGAVRRAGAFLIPPELRIQRQQVDDRHDQAASAPDFAIPVSVATADGVLPASLHNWINLV